MIPILYEKSEQDFSHNGIGFLSDATKATVTEERNGLFELSLQYPLEGIWFDRIEAGSIIKAKANETSEPQLFRVYKIGRPLQGVVTYSAEHISYDLSGVLTLGLSLSGTTAEAAMAQAVNGAVTPCPYSVYSDIPDKRPLIIESPASVRSVFGTIRDNFGGEFEFDNFTVKLHKARGQDNGVTIEYGKNLTDLKQEDNVSECYTHILPYAAYQKEPEEYDETAEPEIVYIYLPEKVVPIPGAEGLGHIKVYPVDFSDRFEEGAEYTDAALRELTEDFLSDTDLGTPKVSLSVSFVQLWQTEEYKNIAPLERVKLCDIVTVKFPRLGVESKSEVIKTVFNVLSEHYEKIELGDVKETLADTVIETEKAIKTIKKSADWIESHIRRTDDRITLEVLHIVENEKEISARIELTESAITAEVSRASDEESRLSSRITQTAESISAEVTRATGAEAELSGKIELTAESLTSTITAETTRAEKVESSLSSDITGESNRAKGVEEELGGRITTTESSLKSEIKQTAESITATVETNITETTETLTGLINDETARADKVEKELKSSITQTAESITAEITAKITTETERAEAKEEELSSHIIQTVESISAEVTRATGAEAELYGKIELTADSLTTEITRATEEEGKLSSRIMQTAESISSEVIRATKAESNLSTKITQTVNDIRLSVSSKTSGNETETTVFITNGTTTLNSVKITGTTAEQAAKITADAIKGITLSVSNSTTNASSTLSIKSGSITLSSAKIEFTGLVTFANLKDGKTEISGDNITTGTISADRIDVSSIYLDRLYTNVGGRKVVIDTYTNTGGNAAIIIGGNGTTTNGNVLATGILASQYVYIGYTRYNGTYGNNLIFDINNRSVFPNNTGTYSWSLGNSNRPFSNFYTITANIGNNTTSSRIGFFGVTPQAKKTVNAASTSSSVTASSVATSLNNLITALKGYGLIA